MSTTYHPTLASAYDSNHVSAYSASIAHTARSKVAMIDRNSQYSRYVPQQHATPQQQRYDPNAVPSHVPATSAQCSEVVSPLTMEHLMTSKEKEKLHAKGPAGTLIYHSLVMPRCINPNGGNLADFAAQMTCFFWFETMDDLKQAETLRQRPPNTPVPRLLPLARPYEQFKKWVYNVLSTTQVTQNVILLALLFIYRLRQSTPQIKGRGGSEYRLLTVALMLGNKFLDDNTYTNKTWAEVSSFAVTEIHVMEVEFLSNMRYNLLTSAKEWDQWLEKLCCFHEYYEKALRLPPSPTNVSKPVSKLSVSPVPSPTANASLDTENMFPATTNYSPSSNQAQPWCGYQSNAVSPLAGKPSLQLPSSRKRVYEDEQGDHPAKRAVPTRLAQVPNNMVQMRQNAAPTESTRLPVPHLTVVTNNPAQQQPQAVNSYTTPTTAYPHQQVQPTAAGQPHVSLPPLQPGMRAMATIYQQPPSHGIVPQPATAPVPSAAPPPVMGGGPFAGQTLPAHQHFGTPTKRHSPGSLGAFTSSPMAEPFGLGSAVHTPLAHTPLANSPSIYLQHRNSPYKPIRHVNTLLYPPPSASLEQYHLHVPLQPTRMHYQPLGRRNDLRTGVVPEYVLFNRGQPQSQPLPTTLQPPQQQNFAQPQQQQPRSHAVPQGLPYQS